MAPSITSVERDAKILAQWLQERGLELTPLQLENEAPALVRAFWENIGWHESFADLELVHPSEAIGRKRALETLAGWRRDDGVAFPDENLPKRFRMVVQDNSGESFTITDEGDGSDNPMLAGVVRDRRKKPVKTRQRYLSCVSGILIKRALSGYYQESICLSIKDVKQIKGKPLLPALGSGLRRIDEGLILRGIKKDGPVHHVALAFESFGRLVEWQNGLKGVRRMDAPLGGLSYEYAPADLAPVRDAMTDVKSVRTVDEKDWKTVTGRLDGHWVVLSYYTVGATVQVDPADAGVFAAMEARGCTIAKPTPEPVVSFFSDAKGEAPTNKELERAAAKLSDLVDELCPAHAEARIPRSLEPGAPRALTTIANALGWSPALDAALPPRKADNETRLRTIFQKWFSAPLPCDVWGYERDQDVMDHVPQGMRVVALGHGGHDIEDHSILYVDESTGSADPSVLSQRSSEYRPVKIDDRASNFLFQRIVHIACGRSRRARSESTAGLGTPLFPKVCPPELRQLADGVYAGSDIYFRSDQDYGSWLATLPREDLPRQRSVTAYRHREVTRGKALQPVALDGIDGFRAYPNDPKAFGLVEGWPVWIRGQPGDRKLKLWCADDAVAVVGAWVATHNGKLNPVKSRW